MADNNALRERRVVVEPSPKSKSGLKKIEVRVNGTKKSLKLNGAEAAAPQMPSVMPDVPITSVQTSVAKGIPKFVKSAKTDAIQSVIQSDAPVAPIALPAAAEVLEVKEDTPPVKKKYIEKPIGQSVAAVVESDGKENDPYMPELPLPQQDELNENDLPSAMPIAAASNRVKEDPCPQLYDPCTREPIASIDALEKRIRELKAHRNITPVGLYGLTAKTSNYEFLTTVFIDKMISLDDMVSFKLAEKRNPGSDIYEVLCRLFVFFGGIEGVNPRINGNYKFMQQIESNALKVYDDSIDALKQMECLASNKMGISDITLVNVKDDKKTNKPDDPYCETGCPDSTDSHTIKTYLMSVKWYKEEKNAEHYDLEKLFATAHTRTTPAQNPIDIIVFLKSKKDFQIAHNRSYRQYTQQLAKTFYGWHEDVKPFLQDKRRQIFEQADISQQTPLQVLEKQYLATNGKPYLSLQLHQDIIVNGVCNTLEEPTDDKRYLIGVLPRGGKTYIAGGIIRQNMLDTDILNILWLTAAPTETLTQVRDDLLAKYEDFKDVEFIDATKPTKKTKRHTVFFCSTQLLVTSQKSKFFKELFVTSDQTGMIFFDEAHKTGTGHQTKGEIEKIISTYEKFHIPFIFLTATYYNILLDYQLRQSHIFIWDYTDVLSARALATDTDQEKAIVKLHDRFTKELVTDVIARRIANGETLETMAKAYIGFPDLYFISADFQTEAIQRFEDQSKYNPDKGFSLSGIFKIKSAITIRDIKTGQNKVRKDAYKIFADITNPKNMISLITPREQFDDPEVIVLPGGEPLAQEAYVKGNSRPLDPSILGRIHNMSSDTKSRFRLDEQPSMLMFMPTGGEGTNILYLLCAWASLLMTHTWWRQNYEIACVVSDESIGAAVEEVTEGTNGIHIISGNVKTTLLQLEKSLHCRPQPKGLLVLAGQMLSMGISLPCTDVVFLLNETKSPDDIIQKTYRAVTPSSGKTSAFVVDLNPVRTLAALYGYTKVSHQTKHTVSELLEVIYDTYSWDSDIFEYRFTKGIDAKPLAFQKRLEELFEKAEKDPEYRVQEDIGGLESRLKMNIKKGMDHSFVATLKGTFSNKKLQTFFEKIGLKAGSTFDVSTGKLVITVPKNIRDPDDEKNDRVPVDTTEITIENFADAVIDFIKYIAITTSTGDFDKALEEYERNQTNNHGTSLQHNVLQYIKAGTSIYEGDDKELLSKILLTAVKDFARESSKSIFSEMKGKIDKDKLRKDKILQIIHRRLTPRKKQKDTFGEVFTPIELVEEMLSHLSESVWSNPDLTWLDPASGIGNFPVVVFYKLDEGLKKWESSDVKRRKHIVENMIFMMELQSNNVRIARDIFKSLCPSATPNILTGDSLLVTTAKLKTHGFPESYDIIMGNPPFNPGKLWEKFINKYVPITKINMLFIVPSTFTSNVTGEKVVEYLKINGLKMVRYLELKDFNNMIDLDTLYFILQKDYNGKININNVIDINRSSPIINFKNEHDSSIFSKLLEYIKSHGNIQLFKGKNKTLDHKNPVETDNVKFKKTAYCNHRMLSRLGGGTHEYYWVHDFIKEESDSPKIVFPRGTASYSSIKTMLNLTKDIVYSTCVDKDEILSNGIMYVQLNSMGQCKSMKWYLMRSKLVRYIFMKVNHLAELTRTLFEYIPMLDVTEINNDNDIYKALRFSKSEITYIDSIFSKSENDAKEGGSCFRKTRKAIRL